MVFKNEIISDSVSLLGTERYKVVSVCLTVTNITYKIHSGPFIVNAPIMHTINCGQHFTEMH